MGLNLEIIEKKKRKKNQTSVPFGWRDVPDLSIAVQHGVSEGNINNWVEKDIFTGILYGLIDLKSESFNIPTPKLDICKLAK